ncbi:MAG: tail assembly protein [Porticoccaceae bacterium]|nr:MAG: tail assembly protein [Porticoccaceae bacterium]
MTRMSDVLMTLGDGAATFRFAIDTAAYQWLTRRTEWRWPAQDRLWNDPARQFTGKGTDEITLEGVILPAFRGGLGQVKAMRELADVALRDGSAARPLTLVTGYGEVLGEWVITSIEEDQPVIGERGTPLEQRFRLTLAAYARDAV